MAGEGKLCDLFFVVVEHGSRPSLRKMGATGGMAWTSRQVPWMPGGDGCVWPTWEHGDPQFLRRATPARQTEAATVSPATGMSRVASTQVRWRDAERGYSRILL